MPQMTDTVRADTAPATDQEPVVSIRNLVKHSPVRSPGVDPPPDRRCARGV